MTIHRIRVQSEPLDIAAEQADLAEGRPQAGAIATFVGLTRNCNQGTEIQSLTIEHYPGMTEKALTDLASAAAKRWPLEAITIIHRVGTLLPQEPIVFVGVASRHRGEAFAACEHLIDTLKTRAPFWKKERRPDGEHWVAARSSDAEAARRWDHGNHSESQ